MYALQCAVRIHYQNGLYLPRMVKIHFRTGWLNIKNVIVNRFSHATFFFKYVENIECITDIAASASKSHHMSYSSARTVAASCFS